MEKRSSSRPGHTDTKTPPAHIVPAVEKALAILSALAESPSGLKQPELARRCGITASTCYRILQTLCRSFWVEKRNSLFFPGNGFLPLLLRLSGENGNWPFVQTLLDDLSKQTRLASKFSIRQGAEQVVLARAESPGPFSISGRAGARFPLIEGSVGAALLADASRAELGQLLRDCADPEIPEKRDPALLFESVEFAHEHRYFLNTCRNRWRIGALSVPLSGEDGRIAAALTLLGMAEDFSVEKMPCYLRILRKFQQRFYLRPAGRHS